MPETEVPLTPTDAELARRRISAEQMWTYGFTQVYIARKLNVSQTTVSRWVNGGQRRRAASKPRIRAADQPDVRDRKPQIGRPPVLTMEQLRKVWLQKECFPFKGQAFADDRWTWKRFSDAVFDTYGVRYSSSSASAILKCLEAETPLTRFDAQRVKAACA